MYYFGVVVLMLDDVLTNTHLARRAGEMNVDHEHA